MTARPGRLSAAAGLTVREREVLLSAMVGESRSETAARLWVSELSVRWHRTNVIRKLGCRSPRGMTEAAVLALRRGLVTLQDVEDYDAARVAGG